LRLIIAGEATPDELCLMVTEKIKAFEHAGWIIASGGSPALVIENYHKLVAANVKRLSINR